MSEQDTREKLEADVRGAVHGAYAYEDYIPEDMVIGWLDRQAAITEREVKERVDFSLITQTANALFPDYQERIAELTAEVDSLREALDACGTGTMYELWRKDHARLEAIVTLGEHTTTCKPIPIVRCRDCRHYREHKFFKSTLGMGLGTDISDVCMFFSNGVKVEPDGFCAWAERREQ